MLQTATSVCSISLTEQVQKIISECKPEWDVVSIKHLCNTEQFSSILLNRI